MMMAQKRKPTTEETLEVLDNLLFPGAELATQEESKASILKQYAHYVDRLAVFHTDVMELLRYMDYHWVGTDNRFATKAKIEALIKQGKEIEYNNSDDSRINFPNSHNSYGVKDYTRREGEDKIH
jgi:hypothetical protein